ncbi:MAG: hypothetical protein ACE5LC_11130 [Candidatus Aminicenantales bacterium]
MKVINVSAFLENLSAPDLEFSHLPLPLSDSQYSKSIRKVVEYLTGFDEIRAIYQVGSISNPGISDIDLIVVFDDRVTSFTHSYRTIFEPADDYLFMHTLYGMPARVFERRELLIPIHECRKLSGRDTESRKELSEDERGALHRVYALEYVVLNFFNLVSQLFMKEVKVRNLLCSFKELVADFEQLSEREYASRINSLSCRISSLRQSWFRDEKASLEKFFQFCFDLVEEMLFFISNFSSNLSCPGTPTNHENKVSNVIARNEVTKQSHTLADMMRLPRSARNDGLPRCARNDILHLTNNSEKYSSFIPSSPIQVGVSSYLVGKNSGQNNRPQLYILSRSGFKFLERLKSSFRNSVLKKQFSDFQQTRYALVLLLPYNLYKILNGQAEDLYGKAIDKRRALLDEYSLFMENIHPDFALFDILRWHNHKSRKWNLIRSLNRASFP